MNDADKTNGLGGVILHDEFKAEHEAKKIKEGLEEKVGSVSVENLAKGFLLSDSLERKKDLGITVAFSGDLKGKSSKAEHIAREYREHGSSFPEYLEGSYCAALYDKQKEHLYLVTDKFGTEPMYYYSFEDGVIFSSHLTSLLACSSIDVRIDRRGILDFISSGYSSTPYSGDSSLVKDVKKMNPGSILVWSDGFQRKDEYWDVKSEEHSISDSEAFKRTEELLFESAKKTVENFEGKPKIMLSGGLDSTFLAKCFDRVSDVGVKTFSWGVKDEIIAKGRERADEMGLPHEEIRFPSDIVSEKEIWLTEEPVPKMFYRRYPLLPDYGIRECVSGIGSEAVFPQQNRTLEIVDSICWASSLFQRMRQIGLDRPVYLLPESSHLDEVSSGVDKIKYESKRARMITEVMSSPYLSEVLTTGSNLDRSRLRSLIKNKEYDLDSLPRSIDKRWGLKDRKFENMHETHTYLVLKEYLPTGEIAQKFRNLKHRSVFLYSPLIAYQFGLPMQQRENRRILRSLGESMMPDSSISTEDHKLYRKEIEHYLSSNWSTYIDTVDSFLEREFLDRATAEPYLLPSKLGEVTRKRIIFMVKIYLLELWIQTIIEREEPWKKPG